MARRQGTYELRSMPAHRKIAIAAAILAALVAGGTAGYVLIEGWSLLDALYQTITTLSTVGYREIHDLSTAGRVFTMALIVAGVGAMLYTVTIIAEALVEGDILSALGVRRQRVKIENLRDHYVLCGYGKVGVEVAAEFARRGVDFLVVEALPEAVDQLRERNYLFIQDDATREEVLEAAGVRRAQAIVAAVGSDADNTYITLTARALNPDALLVARAGAASSVPRLKQAGATRVISPYAEGGRRMALSALQPSVVDFMDTLFTGREGDIILAEIEVGAASPLAGRKVGAVFARTPSASVLALRRADGSLIIGPAADILLEPGDRLIVLGGEPELEALTAEAPETSLTRPPSAP